MGFEKRLYLWDNAKALLILLVVIGHFAQYYMNESNSFKSIWVCIYLFHMPLFIFIAGYFHKNVYIVNKVYYYFVLGILLKILLFITGKITGGHPSFSLFSDQSLPWFMFAMAGFIMITYFLKDIDDKFVFLVAIIIGCYSGYDKTVRDTLILSRILVFYPFYIAGVLAKKRNIFLWSNKKNIILVTCGIIICLWVFICFAGLDYVWAVKGLLTGRNPFPNSFYYYGELVRAGHYLLIAITSLSIILLLPQRKIKLLSFLGQNTLQIYFWHMIFFKVFVFFNILSLCTTSLGKVVYLLISIALTIFLSHKIFSFPCSNIKDICFRNK